MNKKELGINNKYEEDNWKIEGGNIPVADILRNDYRKHRKSLRNKNIMYVEQIINVHNMLIKHWYELKNSTRGRIPLWWSRIKEILEKKNNKNRKIKSEIVEKLNIYERKNKNNQIENKTILPIMKFDGKRNNWLATH